jgi:hypothetical protein
MGPAPCAGAGDKSDCSVDCQRDLDTCGWLTGGVLCNSSADICANDGFPEMGLTPAPSTIRLKTRRFIALSL